MEQFVTVEQAADHLRTESDDERWLALWIPAVSMAVKAWLKDAWRCYEVERNPEGKMVLDEHGMPQPLKDKHGDLVVSELVKVATLAELASQYRFRDGEGASVVPATAGHGYVLSNAATAILASLRRSTVA